MFINKPLALSASVVLHRYGKRTYSLDYNPVSGFIGKPLVFHVDNVVQN